jgi:hypothetical protein
MTDTARTMTTASMLTRVSLVTAPLTKIAARALNVPWPGSAETSRVHTYVQQIADNPSRADLGAALIILSAILFIPSVRHLSGIVKARMPRLGALTLALTTIGCVGWASVGAVSLVAGQITRHSPADVATAICLHFTNDLKTIDLMILAGAAGAILLASACTEADPHHASPRSSSAPAAPP